MVDSYIPPIDHNAASALGTTAAGAASGALSGGASAWWGGVKKLAMVGCVIGLVSATFMTGLITLPAAAAGAFVMPALVSQLLHVAGWGLLGTIVGGGAGVAAGVITIPTGAAVGAFKGTEHAAAQVNNERGAAAVLEAQRSAYIAQARAAQNELTINAPSADNKYSFPPQGDLMNMANPQGLQAGTTTMQYDGRVGGQQLAQAL